MEIFFRVKIFFCIKKPSGEENIYTKNLRLKIFHIVRCFLRAITFLSLERKIFFQP